MELTEDQVFRKVCKQCMQSSRDLLLPTEYERTCVTCGSNTIKPKYEFTKKQREKPRQTIKLLRKKAYLFLY